MSRSLARSPALRFVPKGLSMLAMGTLLYGCQHLEPQLTIGDPAAREPYRSQLRWLEPAPTDTLVQIDELPAQGDGGLWARMRQGFSLQTKTRGVARIDEQRRWLMERPAFLTQTGRAGSRYLHFIVGELSKRNMPLELALLPAIESGFNPNAQSPAQAMGLWQFVPATGRRYQLQQAGDYDERRDIPSSTRAALDYLSYLHDYFDGDWLLALAAYNAGEGRVRDAITRNRARGLATNYWNLSLPGETQNYVPRLLALSQLVNTPAEYGVNLVPIADQPYFQMVALQQPVDLAHLAVLSGVHERELRMLNPAGRGRARGQLLMPMEASRRLLAQPDMIARAAHPHGVIGEDSRSTPVNTGTAATQVADAAVPPGA
ncbi:MULTISPECIES: transglycosylase SLT domain-containing protein [unclassified Pseudomonas]|uniref:transglycosylase SLT domain-containing protein n=1 Tax=unclassified Pseudomonas TaxID=196821 RepID=UPI0008718ED7|nr:MULTISPECIES: transglycosylase SLT domain-containing protein [unclassified Pseudomonas]SCW62172.1 membrane-bound lytic murein transglycosylase D [Pseudomonas sp. NFACC56-3]SFK57007.1 membrane-bound lytic murein transglycosylase D [Pseudomonas sp. NFACC52]